MWKLVGENSKLDASAPKLSLSSASDEEKAGFFLTEIFHNHLCDWFRKGPDAETAVYYVAEKAPLHLAMPEESEMTDIGLKCATALSDVERILKVIHLLSFAKIPEGTPPHVFDDIELLLKDQAGSEGKEIWSVVARSLAVSTFWQRKLQTLQSASKICKMFFPDVTKCLNSVSRLTPNPTLEGAEALAEAATKAEYLQKEMGAELVDNLCEKIIQKFHEQARALPTTGSADDSEAMGLVENYLELAQLLCRVMPLEDSVTTARDDIAILKNKFVAQASAQKASLSIESFKIGNCSPNEVRDTLVRIAKSSGDTGAESAGIAQDALSIIETIVARKLDTLLSDAKCLVELAVVAKGFVDVSRSAWASSAVALLTGIENLLDAVTGMGSSETGFDALISKAAFDQKMACFGRALKTVRGIEAPEETSGFHELHVEAMEWANKQSDFRTALMERHLEMLNESVERLTQSARSISDADAAKKFMQEADSTMDFAYIVETFSTTIASYDFYDVEKTIQGLLKAGQFETHTPQITWSVKMGAQNTNKETRAGHWDNINNEKPGPNRYSPTVIVFFAPRLLLLTFGIRPPSLAPPSLICRHPRLHEAWEGRRGGVCRAKSGQ